jgi:hypothetical protein
LIFGLIINGEYGTKITQAAFLFLQILWNLCFPHCSLTTPLQAIRKNSEYIGSDSFRKATKEGFLASIITNYLDPKLQGYPAAMYCLASISPPSNNRNSTVDFTIAYKLSLEIARYAMGKPGLFRFQDSWTHRVEKNKHISLSLMIPQYHVLIPKPVDQVYAERRWNFYDESRRFLEAWSSREKGLSDVSQRSETWKLVITGLVEMLLDR